MRMLRLRHSSIVAALFATALPLALVEEVLRALESDVGVVVELSGVLVGVYLTSDQLVKLVKRRVALPVMAPGVMLIVAVK